MKSECSSILRYTIQALLTGPNDDFNQFMKRIKQDVESGTGVHKNDTFKDVLDAARALYNNMDESDEWNKVNPTDAKLLALTTQVEQLQKENVALAAAAKSPPSDGSSGRTTAGGGGKNLKGGVEEWRTIKKGDSIVRNGKTFYWCPYHKHPDGYSNGLYCVHKPENHIQWQNNKTRNRNRSNQNTNGQDSANSNNDQSKKLVPNSRMKEVLCSRLMLSDEDADAICKEMQ